MTQSIQALRSSLGAYAKDTKLNIGSVLSEEGSPGLTPVRIYGIALASSYATKQADVIAAVSSDAANILSAEDIEGAKAAATIMAMNNIYYRFVHLSSDKEYATLPAALRMNVIANPGIDHTDFELMSLAVSAITGCGMCIDAHVKQAEKNGVSKQGVQSCIRIASVVNAAAQAVVIG